MSPTTALAGWPKSDCHQNWTDKYGASMAAKRQSAAREQHKQQTS
jgi:hypothetical protein